MRVVNLAKRPFRNRRPVARLAIVLWVLGGVLLALNLLKWGGHFRGSSDSSDRLDLLQRQVSQEEQKLEDYWQELRRVRLGARNQKARYLNLLIHRRTFPWSRLFDQLEEVLPDNVYLENVVPDVELGREGRRTRRSSRATTPKEARERARRRALGQQIDSEPEEDEVAAEQEMPRDRVVLSLGGFARTEEALFNFVDLLYRHDSFLDPNLSRESEEDRGVVVFRIKVVFLTPPRETFPVEIDELPPAEGELATAGEAAPPAEGEAGQGEPARVAASATAPAEQDAAGAADTRTSVTSEEEGEAMLERRGRDFVQETLRERRERAARRAAAREAAAEQESREEGEVGRTTRTGPSRVSVAPRRRTTPTTQTPTTQTPTTRIPTTRIPTTETPSAGREQEPGTSRRPPRTTPTREEPTRQPPTREEPSIDRPTPTQPGASASPRLRGMLEWLPDFLRPELIEPEEVGEAA